MKVEIEIKKRHLHNIFCAAVHHYYRELQSYMDEADSGAAWDSGIIDNLYDIRGACDTISNLCDLIEDLDTVDDDDTSGVIRFDDSEEQK